jgi:PAS domain S-box-containing protein
MDVMTLASDICVKRLSPSQVVNAVLERMKGLEFRIRAFYAPTADKERRAAGTWRPTVDSAQGIDDDSPTPLQIQATATNPAMWSGFGMAYIGAMIGGLIQQGCPLHVVLTALCSLFDAVAEGYCSSVFLFDRDATRVRHAVGPGLPPNYVKRLLGTRLGCDSRGEQPVLALPTVPGLRWYVSAPILSLTGEVLGIFAVYQRDGRRDGRRCHAALIEQFSGLAGIAIERLRSEEALRRSEALLAKAQQLSSTGSFCWHVERDDITWSKELYRLFELDSGLPVSRELIEGRMHYEDVPSFREVLERARGGVDDFEYELRVRLPDDSVRYLHVVAHGMRDQEGQLEYIGAVQDVTQRHNSEEALARLRAELARVARTTSLGALTASIAHEVNQPLAGIMTNASTCRRMLAADPPDVAGARETAQRAIRDAERAAEVIKRLRALFARKGTTSESLDLNEATREVVALSLSELQRNRVILRTELADDLPRVQGDRVQLQQVILNLLLNASEAMSTIDTRPRVLRVRTEPDQDLHVRLSVQDAGSGYGPQEEGRLFEAFYSTKKDGMGIGLSVSRSIIESHHGRLWATRNEGPGATFSFSIPQRP